MGFGYKVIVAPDLWPTARQLDKALEKAGEAVRLLVRPGTGDDPFRALPGESIPVLCGSKALIIDGRTWQWSPEADVVELRDAMESDGMDVARLDGGAWVLGLTLHETQLEWDAAEGLMRTLVRRFGGYGLDFRSKSFGEEQWADGLPVLLKKDKADYDAMVARIRAENRTNMTQKQVRTRLRDRLTALFGKTP